MVFLSKCLCFLFYCSSLLLLSSLDANAFLYFLPDYEPKEQTEAEARGCAKLGYTVTRSNCAAPRILKDKCPVGNSYKTCYCAGSPTCTGSTSKTNPYSSSTGASVTSCVNCAGSTLYSWTCSSTTCSSYSLSSCPSHGNCSKCCNGKYKLNSCATGYSVSGNSCVEDCNSSSSNWCPVHSSCHVNCCTDGTIESCDTRCGGSGCEAACTPLSSETGCSYGTYSCSDGCDGTRTCCSSAPTTSSDPCSGVTCSDGKTCSNGSCVCPSGYSQYSSCSNSPTTTGTCSCGETGGTCYKNMVDYDGQDCATNDCATFTCTCCESFGDFQSSCCTYD